ncbi:MAG: succinate dehydrogenase / fumarate reductase, cytochrome b subunit [Chthoniobacter sp.]|jgi:succinate dehydrogenase / fumarate reductase cytochrome b subunit|nr:succinate dehydrogenase / fumarate reductase, cytochrome b subunit [Chthoniobacter sp.]
MAPLTAFYQSSIGKKWIVALTGLVLIAYVLGHLVGNLQIFLPANENVRQINQYGHFLHSLGLGLWAVRIFLIACFVLHIFTTVQLAMQNRAARPERYAVTKQQRASLAGRTMIISGLIVLAFVIFHVLHFTTHTVASAGFKDLQPVPVSTAQSESGWDVYHMVIRGFQNPFVAGFYILGMFLLCSHLSHGFGSFFQTLGLNTKSTAPLLVNGGRILAWLIFVGYVSIPIAVMLGFLK